MPVLPDPRHELFCQLRLEGKTVDQAYQGAGFKANRGNAARLNANESIRARMEELLTAGFGKARTDFSIISGQRFQ